MKKHLLAIAISMLPIAGFASDDTVKTAADGSVTITSGGRDARLIVHSLFTQAKKSYVLQPQPFKQLHLNLESVPFEEALQIVCKLGQLQVEVKNGIYFISKDPNAVKSDTMFSASSDRTDKPTTVASLPSTRLPHSVLGKKITTRMQKTDIREVFADFANQTGINIEVAANVPQYKIDAFLIDTSLMYSLNVINKAAGLKFRFTDRLSIEIYKPEPPQKASLKQSK
ncbi:MAG: hypothetical protein WAO58_04285 [Fimbriimonadaceae bacterium]